jgi:hypothetical protein
MWEAATGPRLFDGGFHNRNPYSFHLHVHTDSNHLDV